LQAAGFSLRVCFGVFEMALTMPSDESGTFELCPEGNHVAVCASIVDKGTQVVSYAGQPDKNQRKVRISWEIINELRNDGKPFYVSKNYTLSSNEKSNLRKDLESWRGVKFQASDFGPGGFELKNVLGIGCMINVIHTDGERVYANIASIARLPKGMAHPQLHEPPIYFSLEPDEYSPSVFDGLHDKSKEEIMQSPEWQRLQTIGGQWPKSNDELDATIPF
jgi:hypothetical protein